MKNKVCGIYNITNNLNGMEYYGQSIDCLERWNQHKSPSSNVALIDKAINEFGKENFTFSIEKECPPEELDFYEREFIEKNNSLWPNGYNRFGGGKKNCDVCEEFRQHTSETQKGRKRPPFTEEHRRKISEGKKGKPLSEEHKQKLSELMSGEKHPLYGKHHTEETKRKMSDAKKGKHPSEETKRKMGMSHKGSRPKQKWITPKGEVREMNIALVKQWHPDWIMIE